MNKGISLISLTVIVIVMLILAGVTIYTSNIIEHAHFQEIFTNMQLIKTKVNIINEKVLFEGEESKNKYYVGSKLTDNPEMAESALTSEELVDENYYIIDQNNLNNIGLNSIKLKSGEIYIVNYNTRDIIYPKGCKDMDGNIVYRLSEMME